MPQQRYGRNVKAQSDYGATQRAYQYSPRAAQDYLSGDQEAAYESARKAAFTPFLPGQGFRAARPEIDQREMNFNRMDKLREIAGVNALGDFTKQAGQMSKPWKLQAAQGFLTENPDVNREEPVMTAHPGRMGSLSDPNSYVSRRTAMTTRQENQSDESFNLLKDDDSRLKLKAKFEAQRMGMGLGAPLTPQMPRHPRKYADYIRAIMGQQAAQADPEKEYAGY